MMQITVGIKRGSYGNFMLITQIRYTQQVNQGWEDLSAVLLNCSAPDRCC